MPLKEDKTGHRKKADDTMKRPVHNAVGLKMVNDNEETDYGTSKAESMAILWCGKRRRS